MNAKYQVVKDGSGWGVEWEGALINDISMSKAEAMKLADDCNYRQPYRDTENPSWENPEYYTG